MDVKDLNKPQLILLAILLSFVTSIATGITTVTLMEQAPTAVTVPINKIIRQTVEKVVPVPSNEKPLTVEQKKLLENLKAIQPLTVSLYLKGEEEDKLLGTGLFLGENKIVIASVIPEPKEGEIYIARSILGEKEVFKITPEEDFTLIELEADTFMEPNNPSEDSTDNTNDTNNTDTANDESDGNVNDSNVNTTGDNTSPTPSF